MKLGVDKNQLMPILKFSNHKVFRQSGKKFLHSETFSSCH